jgi:hypothetical protein
MTKTFTQKKKNKFTKENKKIGKKNLSRLFKKFFLVKQGSTVKGPKGVGR